jgi:hypothetical protein
MSTSRSRRSGWNWRSVAQNASGSLSVSICTEVDPSRCRTACSTVSSSSTASTRGTEWSRSARPQRGLRGRDVARDLRVQATGPGVGGDGVRERGGGAHEQHDRRGPDRGDRPARRNGRGLPQGGIEVLHQVAGEHRRVPVGAPGREDRLQLPGDLGSPCVAERPGRAGDLVQVQVQHEHVGPQLRELGDRLLLGGRPHGPHTALSEDRHQHGGEVVVVLDDQRRRPVPGAVQGSGQDLVHPVGVHRFGQPALGPGGQVRVGRRGQRGHHDDRDAAGLRPGLQLADRLPTGHPGHAQVQQDDIGMLGGRPVHRVAAAADRGRGVTVLPQQHPQHLAGDGIVVAEQHRRGVVAPGAREARGRRVRCRVGHGGQRQAEHRALPPLALGPDPARPRRTARPGEPPRRRGGVRPSDLSGPRRPPAATRSPRPSCRRCPCPRS